MRGYASTNAAWLLPTLALLSGCGNAGTPAPMAPGGDAARGKLLLAHYQCGACHQIPGVDAARGMAGPTLEGYARRSYIAGFLPNYPDALVRWIVDPPALKHGTAMPAMGVSEDEARHMAAYLYTLR